MFDDNHNKLLVHNIINSPEVHNNNINNNNNNNNINANNVETERVSKALSFFNRYQILMKQKQISHFSKSDKNEFLVVKDDNYIYNNNINNNFLSPNNRNNNNNNNNNNNKRRGSFNGLKSPIGNILTPNKISNSVTKQNHTKYTLNNNNNNNVFSHTEIQLTPNPLNSNKKINNNTIKKSTTKKILNNNNNNNNLLSPKGKLLFESPIPKRLPKKQLMPIIGRGEIAKLSPRSKYLNICIQENVMPRQQLVNKVTEQTINIQNQGLGDSMCKMFMECYKDLKSVETVNLTDNNLTDIGLAPSINSLSNMPNLTYLDISENIMGPNSAEALLKLLDTHHCPLQKLIIRKCNLDDYHCQCFVAALLKESYYSNLIELNLSNNKLGSSEVVNASNQTTGEAIATWLSRPECILQKLDVSWNTIRTQTGIALSNSLALNHSLTYLDLSYNGLGTEGGCTLGAALIHNYTLKKLIISNNNLDSTATFTICAGIMENNSLEEVILDSNPIGEKGATILMMIPLIHFGKIKLSAKKCNLSIKDTNCWFDFHKLPGRYLLKMNKPYERAVALILLRLVAFHHSCIFSKFDYDINNTNFDIINLEGYENGSDEYLRTYNNYSTLKSNNNNNTNNNTTNNNVSKFKPIKINLISKYLNREKLLDNHQKLYAENMKNTITASADAIHAMKLFKEVDRDSSDGIDKHELKSLMISLGIELSDYRLRETMATYDTDGSGSIDHQEFIVFLNHMKLELEKHLHQLLHIPMYSLDNNNNNLLMKHRNNNKNKNKNNMQYGNINNFEGRYIPPLVGTFLIEVIDSHTFKDVVYTVASCNRIYSDIVAVNTPDPETVKQLCLTLTQIRVDDAVRICNTLSKKHKNVIHILIKLLYQVSSVTDARLLISEVIDGDRTKMYRLKKEMGPCLKTTIGMLNGFYSLNLSIDTERRTLISLYEQSRTVNHHKAEQSPLGYGLTGDTSQKGNWSSFRNELYDSISIVIDDDFISCLPTSGILEFDYSGEQKFISNFDVVTKDFAVVNILIHIGLLTSNEINITMQKLKEIKELCNINNTIKKGQIIYERSWEDILKVAEYICKFYENLQCRSEYIEKSKILENIQYYIPTISTQGISTPSVRHKSKQIIITPSKSIKKLKLPNINESKIIQSIPNLLQDKKLINSPLSRRQSIQSQSPLRLLKKKKETNNKKDNILKRKNSIKPNNSINSINSINNNTIKSPLESNDILSRKNSIKFNIIGNNSKSPNTISNSNSTFSSPINNNNNINKRRLSINSLSNKDIKLDSINNNNNINSNNNSILSPLVNRISNNKVGYWKHHTLDTGLSVEADDEIPYEIGSMATIPEQYDDNTTKGDHFYGVIKAATSREHAEYFANVLKDDRITNEAKMGRLIDIIEESFGCYKWICARHVALILQCIDKLSFGRINRTKYFGNYCVDIVVLLFGHIVDIVNFDLVLKELDAYECACVISRIGILNFINPIRPDGSYTLDLSFWDQRQLAKMFILLEINESGENWSNKQFRWIIDQPPVPSWVLTKMWLTEEGMPQRGILDITYYSGEMCGKRGCIPSIPYRKSLLYMSALKESDFTFELNGFKDENDKDVDTLVGLNVMKTNIDVWKSYLVHGVNKSNIGFKGISVPRRIHKPNENRPLNTEKRSNVIQYTESTPMKTPSITNNNSSAYLSRTFNTISKPLIPLSIVADGLEQSLDARLTMASTKVKHQSTNASLYKNEHHSPQLSSLQTIHMKALQSPNIEISKSPVNKTNNSFKNRPNTVASPNLTRKQNNNNNNNNNKIRSKSAIKNNINSTTVINNNNNNNKLLTVKNKKDDNLNNSKINFDSTSLQLFSKLETILSPDNNDDNINTPVNYKVKEQLEQITKKLKTTSLISKK